ncbi:MAG: glycosyltransferase family 1 protein, partial [Candidatus Omnitrophota bacterium]|nr:glycosyltransferase family 1 protein [Candidatus Omnitrophota bacterium]
FCVTNNAKDLTELRKKYNADTGYILHISSQDPRDNTPAVIRAYHKTMREPRISQKLVIYGDINPKDSGLDKLVAELELENNVTFIRRFKDKETERLVELYRAADVYIDPSLYEGFGFQVVEAMACGVPVITSNVTSLPEIMGDAGILVSPTDIDSLASAIIMVLTDSRLRQTLCQKSLERTKFFSWDKTARETLAIYDELLA